MGVQTFNSDQYLAGDVPDGGSAYGPGFCITWQRGPLVVSGERREPNGAFLETIIEAVVDRLVFLQDTKFQCEENDQALRHLGEALDALHSRTKKRVERGVEGTATV